MPEAKSFIFRFPVFTVLRHDGRDRGTVLTITKDDQHCAHLFTDWDLCEAYVCRVGLDGGCVGVRLNSREELLRFLQQAPSHVHNVVLDPTARDGRPFRGIVVAIGRLLEAISQPQDGRPRLPRLDGGWIGPESYDDVDHQGPI